MEHRNRIITMVKTKRLLQENCNSMSLSFSYLGYNEFLQLFKLGDTPYFFTQYYTYKTS